jgi:hypothetical protein
VLVCHAGAPGRGAIRLDEQACANGEPLLFGCIVTCRMGNKMPAPTLDKHGDPMEQKWWAAVQPHFPLYEGFWQAHIFTLRGANGQIRADIDERIELMAQAHYKCLVSATVIIEPRSKSLVAYRTVQTGRKM